MSESDLGALQPPGLWRLFEAITRVPRCTGKEQAIRGWVRQWAAEAGIPCREDAAGNLLLRREASPGREGDPTLVLQAHLDMVCVRAPGAAVDPEKDPLRLRLHGGGLRAEGTSLGADDGIGVALCLAALADGAACGPLEALLTVDEEGGFSGALGVKPGFFTGKYLLNLDSEELGVITIGTAGGEYVDYSLARSREPGADGPWRWLRLSVGGLAGGHSGIDIHRGRLNAIKVLVEAAAALRDGQAELPLRVGDFSGGTAANAIPPAARLVLGVPASAWAPAREALQRWRARAQPGLRAAEPGLRLRLGPECEAPASALAPADSRRLLGLLAETPHGPLAWSSAVPDLVETSNNLALVSLREGDVEVRLSSRSCREPSLEALGARLRELGQRHGAAVKRHSRYPGWQPEPDSPFLALLRGCYAQALGRAVECKAFHAGLECGVFKALDPELQIASIGPEIRRVHTPEEELDVGSVGVVWATLGRLLRDMHRLAGEGRAGR